MRQAHSESQFRLALFSLQDADGYVDALLEMAHEGSLSRRPAQMLFPPRRASRAGDASRKRAVWR